MMGNGRLFAIVAACAAVFIGSVAAYAEDATYISNKQCKMCHNSKAMGQVWTAWKAANHSKAFTALASEEAKAIAKEKGITVPPQEAPECLKCHVTSYDPKEKKVADKIVKEDGVQCESCHGPASLHTADGKKIKSDKDAKVDLSAHIVRPDKKICLTCHNDKSPTWDPEKYTSEDGKKSGFDFKEAWKKIAHGKPKDEAAK